MIELTDAAQKVLCKRYLLKDSGAANTEVCPHCEEHHETVEQMFRRISFGSQEFYELMSSLRFLPNSPTIFNAGTGQGTLSACFKFDVDDSMVSIMDVANKAAMVQKWGGGVGYTLSKLRAAGTSIASTHGKACGPIAVMKLYQSVSEMITQGGKRDAAQIAILQCDHPDIRDFISCKKGNDKVLNTFNLSVAVTDEFMSKVANSTISDENKLFREICNSAWESGEPGLYFIDEAERHNPTPDLGKLTGTNPCGEVPLLDNEPCNLGSINLVKHYSYLLDGLDWSMLAVTIRCAVRYLNTVLDNNDYPVKEIKEAANLTRKIGLGVMGWADLLALQHIDYDSITSVEYAEEVMKFINNTARQESISLAGEYGSFPAYEEELHGGARRNATVTCIAPSGSISVIAGCSAGIEPHFIRDGSRYLGDREQVSEKIRVHTGNFIPKIVHEVHWEWQIKMLAAFQKYTNLAVSKTVNLPSDATISDVSGAYLLAWQLGCKGVTVYRDKSRGEQVIDFTEPSTARESIPIVVENKEINGRRRMTTTRKSITHKFDIGEFEGYLTVGLFEDGKPGEVFITSSKQGSTIEGLLDSVAIVVSMSLQYGVPITTIINKFRGTRFEPAGLTQNKDIQICTSVLDYVARWLALTFNNSLQPTESGMLCPDCQLPAVLQDGCLSCGAGCGWSRCG